MSFIFSGTSVYTTVGRESIKVWDDEIIYPIGALSRCLLEANDLFWSAVKKMSTELTSISNDALTILQKTEDFTETIPYYEDAIQVVASFKKQAPNLQPLKDLVLAMPAQDCYANYHRRLVRIDFLEAELDYFRHALLNCDNIGTPEHEKAWLEFNNRKNEIGEIRCILHIYEQWLKVLQNPLNKNDVLKNISFFSYHDYYKKTFEHLLNYALDIERLIGEISRRTHLLSIATKYTPEDKIYTVEKCKNSLIIDADSPRQLTFREAKTHYEALPNVPLYSFTSISSLLAAELTLFDKYNIPLHLCEICNLPFFSSQNKAKYCHFSNSSYSGLPCNIVAATLLKEADEIHKILIRNRNSYGTWVRRCRSDSPPTYMINLKSFIFRTSKNIKDRKKAEELWNNILKEIKIGYATWSDRASRAVGDYKMGRISKEDCLTLIKIPSEYSERSILLGENYAAMENVDNV